MAETGILGVRSWRIKKGITLDKIADQTKLSLRQLEAIECGDFKKLPGGIYNTNYIKQYARAIGFDEQGLLAYYKDEFASPVVKAPEQKRPQSRISGPAFQN